MDILIRGCRELGIELTEKQIEQFQKFYEYLVEKNKVMNLTAITESEEVQVKHFLDSVAAVKAFDFNKAGRVLDLGTGAGFPGVPLKIVFPDMDLVLMDSLNKRVKFLEEVIEMCGLEKVTAVHGRAEEMARNKLYREQFDTCLSRAVANLSTLSEYCIPFVKKGGRFISYKSINIDMELKDAERALKLLGGKAKEPVNYHVPESDFDRTVIVIEKVNATPKVYPRKAGTPSKDPL